MARWQPSGAQQAVDIVAAVMAGRPAAEVRAELDHWLSRREAVLGEPLRSSTVAAIAGGCRVVVLPFPAPPVRGASAPELVGAGAGPAGAARR